MKYLIDKNTKIIIVGTYPGKKSLVSKHYYVDRRNHFWYIIKNIINEMDNDLKPLDEMRKNEEELKKREDYLKEHGIGLWDMIESCSREGSSDSFIENVKPNNLTEIIEKCPDLTLIIPNGRKASKYLKKYFSNNITLMHKICIDIPPSTSGNNSRYNKHDKLLIWKELFKKYGFIRNKEPNDKLLDSYYFSKLM